MTAEAPAKIRRGFRASVAPWFGHRIVVAQVLFFGFLGFYLNSSQILRDTPVYDRLDVFFESDSRRVWKDMVGERLGNHSHSSGHPNFVIFHQPVGWTLTRFLKQFEFEEKKIDAAKTASTIMTSAAGAGVVVFFHALLVASHVPRHRAILFSCVLGFSTVQMFFAAIPETYIFSALGLTAAAWLAIRLRTHEAWWQLAAVYAWSALTTNIVQIGIWSLVRHRQHPWRIVLKRVALGLAISCGLMVALNAVQILIYPQSDWFFIPHSIAREAHWVDWKRFESPVEHTRILLQHQWISNIVAPDPVRVMNRFRPEWPTASVEAGTWGMFAPAWPIFALWGVVLLGALPALFDRRFYSPAMLGALAVMAFNFCFFFIFGHDRMLYAALWTSVSVFVIAMGWESLMRRLPALGKIAPLLLAAVLAGQAWHNWHFLGKIAAMVK